MSSDSHRMVMLALIIIIQVEVYRKNPLSVSFHKGGFFIIENPVTYYNKQQIKKIEGLYI